jgi:hypothetical protein
MIERPSRPLARPLDLPLALVLRLFRAMLARLGPRRPHGAGEARVVFRHYL